MWVKACVCFFSLFLKNKCISSLFRTKSIEKKFNLHLFFLPTVSRIFILPWATTRYTPTWNFLFRKNNCMCNRDNARDVAACPDEYSTKRSEPKGLQTSAIFLIPRSTCHWTSNQMRYFLKNIFWSKHFPATTNCRQKPAFVGVSCETWKFPKFPRRTFPVGVSCNFVLKSNFMGMFFLEIYKIFRTAILRNCTFFVFLHNILC